MGEGGVSRLGGQGSNVYVVLCGEPKEHKQFRMVTRPGGSVAGVTDTLFMCQMFMCLFWPPSREIGRKKFCEKILEAFHSDPNRVFSLPSGSWGAQDQARLNCLDLRALLEAAPPLVAASLCRALREGGHLEVVKDPKSGVARIITPMVEAAISLPLSGLLQKGGLFRT